MADSRYMADSRCVIFLIGSWSLQTNVPVVCITGNLQGKLISLRVSFLSRKSRKIKQVIRQWIFFSHVRKLLQRHIKVLLVNWSKHWLAAFIINHTWTFYDSISMCWTIFWTFGHLSVVMLSTSVRLVNLIITPDIFSCDKFLLGKAWLFSNKQNH